MKLCLILFLAVTVTQAQSVLVISSGGAASQKTNETLSVMSNSSLWARTNHLLMYSPPKQYNMAGWRLPNSESESTNDSTSAFGITNEFHNVITIAKTNNTTNVNERAIYNRVGSEANYFVITGKVASVQNNILDKSTPK